MGRAESLRRQGTHGGNPTNDAIGQWRRVGSSICMQVLTTASFLMGSGAASGVRSACKCSSRRRVSWAVAPRRENALERVGVRWRQVGQRAGSGRHVAGTRQATERQQPTAAGGGMGAGRAGRPTGRISMKVLTTALMPPVGSWAAWATVTSPFVRTSSRDLPNKGQGSRPGAS